MKAITFHGVSDVRATDVADPKLVDATDVLLRITTSAVWHGRHHDRRTAGRQHLGEDGDRRSG